MSLKSKVDYLVESAANRFICGDNNCPCRDLDNITREEPLWDAKPFYIYERNGQAYQVWHGPGFRISGGYSDQT